MASMIDTCAEIDIAASAERIWSVLWDVARYPEFLTDVLAVALVGPATETRMVANFDIKIFRARTVALELTAERPQRLKWRLVESEHLEFNEGEWALHPGADGAVRLSYRIRVATTAAVPAAITKRLIDFNLPAALRQFKSRIEGDTDVRAALLMAGAPSWPAPAGA